MVVRLRRGFTLIELLIVVAIIAILAAIAVPNFMEAQTRAKISRTQADMRALATALTSYCVDTNSYPPIRFYAVQNLYELTTPISYITSVGLQDPFLPQSTGHTDPNVMGGDTFRNSYVYTSYDGTDWQMGWHPNFRRKGVVVVSWGPDRKHNWGEHYPVYFEHPEERDTWGWGVSTPIWTHMVYDATNGTKSWGDICRAVGDFACSQQVGG